ncbi:MAG: hypothetical protein HY646_17160 [Acidobacteria bacterium]|nr:hypothetical protein [Acidobacteriota bacterium]
MINIGTRDFSTFRLPFARYLCARWNEDSSTSHHLDHVSIIFMREPTPPPGQQSHVERLEFLDYTCH